MTHAHRYKETGFDILDGAGNLIAQDIQVRGDFFAEIEGDGMRAISAACVEVQVWTVGGNNPDDRFEGGQEWLPMPEDLGPAFKRWLQQEKTRQLFFEWFGDDQ